MATRSETSPKQNRPGHRRPAGISLAFVLAVVSSLLVVGEASAPDVGAAEISTIIAPGSSWRYSDAGGDQGVAWRLPGAVTSGWPSGSAPLGWGNPVATAIRSGQRTAYFVRDVNVNLASVRLLRLRLRRDDGAVVSFNGVPVARSFMPFGEPRWSTLATAAQDAAQSAVFVEYLLPRDLLVNGPNRIAVEIHQATDGDADAVFDLGLWGLDSGGDSSVPVPPTASATAVPTAIELGWGVEPADVVAHRIRRGSQTIAIVPVRTQRYLDQRLTPGATFAYSVSSIDGGGNESPSTVVSARVPISAGTPTASFDTVGDLGVGTATSLILPQIQADNTGLFVALGDLSYGGPGSEPSWCRYVRSKIPTMPIALVPGNHEQDNGPDGFIGNFVACQGPRPVTTGSYPQRYTVSVANLARVIVISPGIPIGGITENFAAGSPERAWLVAEIARARAAVPWVFIAIHKPCMSVGAKPCEIDAGLQEVLSTADVVLFGHDHIYQRSHQLGSGPGCAVARVVPVTTQCVRDDGFDGQYIAGNGSVQVIVGVGGQSISPLNLTSGNWPLVAVANGSNSWSSTDGYLSVDLTPASVHLRFRNVRGRFADDFMISKP